MNICENEFILNVSTASIYYDSALGIQSMNMSCLILLFFSYDSDCYPAKAQEILTPNIRYLWQQNTIVY